MRPGGESPLPEAGSIAPPAPPRRPDLRITVPGPPPPPPRIDAGLPPVPEAPPGPAPAPAPPEGPTPVPSCQLIGRRLYNFALNDVSGKPWEFRRDRTGRLVLIDFWHTECPPCLAAIGHLNDLQRAFGPYGLEVVGIACERGPPQERVRHVTEVRRRYAMAYRTLMAGDRQGSPCPVTSQFGVVRFPTAKLIDDKGNIVWESVGLPQYRLNELKAEIQRRLDLPPR